MPDSANDPSAAVVVHPPRLLVLEQGAMRVHRNGEAVKRDELWQGEARDPYVADAPLVPVYVRVTEPNPLVAELLCGLIARALGLPSPETFVILLEPGRLSAALRAIEERRSGVRDRARAIAPMALGLGFACIFISQAYQLAFPFASIADHRPEPDRMNTLLIQRKFNQA